MKEKKENNLLKKIFLMDIKIGEKNWFIYLLLSSFIWQIIGCILFLIVGCVIK